jgi:phage terminase large subunit-like protein
MVQAGNYFDQAEVDHVIRFIESLTLTKATKSDGPEPFILLPHWRDAITQLYGWRRSDGRRQYRKAFLTCGRKQAKTQFAAGVCTYEFFLGDTARHEIYFAATDVKQAGICFDAVADMIAAEPDLEELCKITPSLKEIHNRQNGNIMRVLSAEGAGKHGYNPSLVVMDEFHVWGNPHLELYRALTTGGKSRRDPLRIMPTTAGHDMESLWGQEYRYAKDVLAGRVKDPSYLALIHEVPMEADWTDRSLWPLALPLLTTGHHQIEDYEEDFLKAQQSPSEQATFRRLYLNQPMGSETVWLDMHTWDKFVGTVDEAILRKCPCFGGLDLGATRDLTAFTLAWKLPDGNVFVRSWGYLPEDDVRGREKRDAVPYGQWSMEGHILLTPGDVTDWRFVVEHIQKLNEQYQIQGVCYDPWGARDTAVALSEGRIDVIKFGQDYRDQSPAVKRVEELLYMGRLIHENDPSLRWCVDNTMVKTDDNGHRKIAKVQRLTNRKRIDKAASMVMAVGGLIQAEEYSDPYSDGRAALN